MNWRDPGSWIAEIHFGQAAMNCRDPKQEGRN
jgi:hypothetical protein